MAAPKMTPPPAPPPEDPTPPTPQEPKPGPLELVQLPKPQLVLTSREAFELAKDVARAWAGATMVPEPYKGNPANCLIVVDIAARLGMSVLQVMQSLDIIRGRPAWRSQFIIGVVNTCGKFTSSMQFAFSGEAGQMNRACYAYAIERSTMKEVRGDTVSMQMAKDEGWLTREGSKWRTMPELMLRYRAGAFFGRVYVPERLLGLLSVEEVHDIIDVTPDVVAPAVGVAAAKEMLGKG